MHDYDATLIQSVVVEFQSTKQYQYSQKPNLRAVRTLCSEPKKQIPTRPYPTYRSNSPTVSSTGISPPTPLTSLHARARNLFRCPRSCPVVRVV